MPHRPGVYLISDRFNRVIYVGKARDLRKRVSSYFLPSKLAQADLKTRAMLDATWDFETHTVRSEAESVLLEGKLIKEYRPRYNISFRDDKRFLVVRVNISEEWPRFRLARFKKDDGSRYFGPYAHAGALRQTLQFHAQEIWRADVWARRTDGARIEVFDIQVPVRLSESSAEQYRQRVAQACEFLEGKSREMIAVSKNKCTPLRRKWISRRLPSFATWSRTCAARRGQPADSHAAVYPAPLIRWRTCRRWLTHCIFQMPLE